MKRGILSVLLCVIFIFSFVIIFSIYTPKAASLDKEKVAIAKKAMTGKHKYVTTVGTFNGKVAVVQKDRFGRVVGEYEIMLMPGENVEVPEEAAMKKGTVGWKDVARYENMLARDIDPIARWFVENLWRDRINSVLDKLEKKLSEEYPDNYKEINVSVRSITDALGLDPPIGLLTGREFIKIPDRFGGRVPNVNPKIAEKALESSRYFSVYAASLTYVDDTFDEVEPPEDVSASD